jgi:hypothetical protein
MQAGQTSRHVEVRIAGAGGQAKESGLDLRPILCLFEPGEPAIRSLDAICGYTLKTILTVGSTFVTQRAGLLYSRFGRCSLHKSINCKGSWATVMVERKHVRA